MTKRTEPLLTVVIPTHGRPHLLPDAIASALAQTVGGVEVIVVDDGSPEPARVPDDPRVRLVRLPERRGTSAARNAGLAAVRGRFLAYLDDDDVLLPHFAATSLAALERTALPPPVGVLSGLAGIDHRGRLGPARFPPRAMPRGAHFGLEPLERGRSYGTKQTLVVEADVLRRIGGWDESFRSRTATEMFLRLSPLCSLVGLDVVTYHLRRHTGPRLSFDTRLRQHSFTQLVAKHRALLEEHPEGYAALLMRHANMSLLLRQPASATVAVARALRRSPRAVARATPDLGRAVLGALRRKAS